MMSCRQRETKFEGFVVESSMGFFSLTKKKVPCFFYIFLVFMYILNSFKVQY